MQDPNRITLLCVIMVNFKASSANAEPIKFNKQSLDKTESIKWSTTERPHYMSYHTFKLSQFTETPTKQTMIAVKEAVLTMPWHYCYLF